VLANALMKLVSDALVRMQEPNVLVQKCAQLHSQPHVPKQPDQRVPVPPQRIVVIVAELKNVSLALA